MSALAGSGWVTCAPGDPTEHQWRTIRELAGGNHYCATRWNERSGWVRVEITRADGLMDVYSVAPRPEVYGVRYLHTETLDGEQVQR